jgi:hypothetical protein
MPEDTSFSANVSMCNGIVANEPRFAAISEKIDPANLLGTNKSGTFSTTANLLGTNKSGTFSNLFHITGGAVVGGWS